MISEKELANNQHYINFWTAYAYYNDLKDYCEKYIDVIEHEHGENFDINNLFKKDYSTLEDNLSSYCRRSKMVKMATETCELLCKAILIEEGKVWNDMKGLGHNISDLIQALPSSKNNVLLNMPIEYFMNYPCFFAVGLIPPLFPEENEVQENYEKIMEYIESYSTGKILPNIKSRYPGQTIVDFNEKFIIAFAKLLYSLAYTYTNNKDYYLIDLYNQEKLMNMSMHKDSILREESNKTR